MDRKVKACMAGKKKCNLRKTSGYGLTLKKESRKSTLNLINLLKTSIILGISSIKKNSYLQSIQ